MVTYLAFKEEAILLRYIYNTLSEDYFNNLANYI